MNIEQKQIEREKTSANAGYQKFLKEENERAKNCNGSNTTFGIHIKNYLLDNVVKLMEQTLIKTVGVGQAEAAKVLVKNIGAEPDGSTNKYFSASQAAFIGIQLALDTALNPNKITHKIPSKYGGDKKLLEKKTVAQLEHFIGRTVHRQMSLKYIEETFPGWFRMANKKAEYPTEGGAKSTTAHWEGNLFRAVKKFAEYLHEKGEHTSAEMITNHKCWTYQEETIIGSLILQAVVKACHQYIQVVPDVRHGKKSLEIELTTTGVEMTADISEYVKLYASDLLPMLIKPQPITNESIGGWLSESLQEPEQSINGSIVLSNKHLEFINRQARVAFQINPFTQVLMQELCDRELKLGKFYYQTLQDIPNVASELGYSHLDKPEQDLAVRNDNRSKGIRRRNSDIYSNNIAKLKSGMIAYQVKDKAEKLLDDEQFFIPMKYDFRGRIYSRVPFISFQSNDAGRYLIRFADRTPADDKTAYWLKIGISNAGGNDKLTWDERIKWFDRYEEDIINVGRMVDDGDFTRAYEFLTKDCIEDAFCLAALANEYVKVIVDETQDYTQTFVCVDASCSGTSIFNAWRRNLTGALKTNLVDTNKPADIYTEVWNRIKELAPDGTFREYHIKQLEQMKLIRKMMKGTYVPAQYASPESEQKRTLANFNKKLATMNLEFNPQELEALQTLWIQALDDVSSINTVVKWFRKMTSEVLKDNDEVYFRTVNGSLMTLKYPKCKRERIRVMGYGSALYRKSSFSTIIDEPNKRKLLNAVCANITHSTDAAALCEALWNWIDTPFVAIHDAAGFPPGNAMDDALKRLKDGLVTATDYDVWNAFRDENKITRTPANAAPIVGDLKDWDMVRNSNYLFS